MYVKDQEARITLLTQKLSFKEQLVHIYEDSPFRAGITGPDHKVKKIIVKYLPLSKGNSALETCEINVPKHYYVISDLLNMLYLLDC